MKKQIKTGLLLAIFLWIGGTHVDANETHRYMLIPGGDAVGIHIETQGLIVVDTYLIETECGEFSPAREAGLVRGDVITAIHGQQIASIDEYKEALIAYEGLLVLTVNRGENVSEVVVAGCKNLEGEMTTGVYLRNKVAGIGTLTYVDPASQKYGALGHEIIDQDTNRMVDIRKGELIDSEITSIRKATDGNPGEKIAEIHFDEPQGNVEKNNQYGIYGSMINDSFNAKPMMPIAYQDEINVGPATIWTVLDGQHIEEFEIEIIEVVKQTEKEIKGIKYIVTDARLLETTGGIVQGMSGSPIVQDGKIIGAVTHVLVHDSTLGYGVFIEWMLEESDINYKAHAMTPAFKPAA